MAVPQIPDRLRELIASVGDAWAFVTRRWATHAEIEPHTVAIIALIVALLTAVPAVWRMLRQASTIIHEMGHVFAAWITGRHVSGIKLHTDTSGVTISYGSPTGPGLLVTALAGYPAPGLLAVLLVWLVSAGHAGAGLTIHQAICLLAVLLARNLVGIASCLLMLLATGVIWWHDDPQMVASTVVVLAIFYALAGVRGTVDVLLVHLRSRPGRDRPGSPRRPRTTDASQAAGAWWAMPLPAALWLLFFTAAALISAGSVVHLLATP